MVLSSKEFNVFVNITNFLESQNANGKNQLLRATVSVGFIHLIENIYLCN